MKFRNYKPYDVTLLKKAVTVSSDFDARASTYISQVGDVIKAELSAINQEDELNIVPKKLNWDLKSQIASKIERLERRTQRAIVELLREKMAKEDGNDTDNETD